MSKTVVIKRDGSGVTATPINSPKMRYYPTLEAAENAIANGEVGVGEVISIKEGNEADNRDASLPVGTIVSYYSNNIPSGWLLCDGSEFDTAKYPLLYALLGKDTTPVEYDLGYPGVTTTLKAAVSITSYQSTSNYYTVPADGYVQISNGGTSNEGIICYCQREDGTWQALERITTHTNTVAEYGAIRVSKGMKVYFQLNNIGAGASFIEITADKYKIIKAVQGNINEAESAAVKSLVDGYSYSTSEVATGATWIDGKPIYRRTFTGLAFAANTETWTDTGATIEGVDTLIKGFGVRKVDGFTSTISTIDFQMSGNKVMYQHFNANYTNVNILVLEYTKE